MIYLFDRLYIDIDQYIRNDSDTTYVLLGPTATEAKKDPTLKYDFKNIQLDESVVDDKLAGYLENLSKLTQKQRVVLYTNAHTLIKILAFYCSSVFEDPDHAFIKKLILLDKTYIEQNPVYQQTHKDKNLRYKGLPKLDLNDIDTIISQAMSIQPKLSRYNELRIEYTLGAYLNNTLSAEQKTLLEEKMYKLVLQTWWLPDDYKGILRSYLTLAHKRGLNLDTFTIQDLKNSMPNYTKLFDLGLRGTTDVWAKVTLDDQLNFIREYEKDFGGQLSQTWKDLLTNHLYKNRMQFVKDFVLSGKNANKYFAAMDLRVIDKVNPYLWYAIAGSANDQEFMHNFVLNV